MVTFLFAVHPITEAKQYAGLGRAEPGLEPGRWIFQLWCSAATGRGGGCGGSVKTENLVFFVIHFYSLSRRIEHFNDSLVSSLPGFLSRTYLCPRNQFLLMFSRVSVACDSACGSRR